MHFDSGARHGSRAERRHRPGDGDRTGAVAGAGQATRKRIRGAFDPSEAVTTMAIWPSAYAGVAVTPSQEPSSYGMCLYRANDLRRQTASDPLDLGV